MEIWIWTQKAHALGEANDWIFVFCLLLNLLLFWDKVLLCNWGRLWTQSLLLLPDPKFWYKERRLFQTCNGQEWNSAPVSGAKELEAAGGASCEAPAGVRRTEAYTTPGAYAGSFLSHLHAQLCKGETGRGDHTRRGIPYIPPPVNLWAEASSQVTSSLNISGSLTELVKTASLVAACTWFPFRLTPGYSWVSTQHWRERRGLVCRLYIWSST